MSHQKVKPICFYLPQFHSIPENDKWWGEGFTEWRLVDDAKPLFTGHCQPVKPETLDNDLGYYNACDYETRRAQANLAKQYGIYGFCYYHYWFKGKRLLEKPLEKMLEDGEPDLPFCLCWANEPWSRRWSGEEHEVLQPQHYGTELDWENHFNALIPYFSHENYIKVEGCPVFLIYRIGHIPNAEKMVVHWRKMAVDKGLVGIHIVAVEGTFKDNQIYPDYVDAMVEHQPSCSLNDCRPLIMEGLKVYSIEQIWRRSLARIKRHKVHYPGACHAWDNTPRRGRASTVVLPSRPARFRRYLTALFEQVKLREQPPFVFLNAWNEWSEGAHLEPEQHYKDSWLACVRDAQHEALNDAPAPVRLGRVDHPMQYESRLSSTPDIDLINVIIQHQVKVQCALDFGCEKGQSSEYMRAYTGADQYIGLEPNRDWLGAAGKILDEVYLVDADNPELVFTENHGADFIVCGALLNHVADPLGVLQALGAWMVPSGLVCLGFEHAGYYKRLNKMQTLMASEDKADNVGFSVEQAQELVRSAGLKPVKTYQVFSANMPKINMDKTTSFNLEVDAHQFENLSYLQLESLFCMRFFIFAQR
ncbi:MAG: glycoside hydrolase family 99-like domain-containing protein [Arenicellales bacterium]